jgi:hypothetical protein
MNYEPNADHCDKCSGVDQHQVEARKDETRVGRIYRLPTGGDGGINLCRVCWQTEMEYRTERNTGTRSPRVPPVATPFDIVPWPGGA